MNDALKFSLKILIPCTLITTIALSWWHLSQKRESPIKNSLNLNITQDIVTFDPRKGADFVSSTLQFLLFDGLTRMTPYSTVASSLAEKIDVSPDLMTYTFYLREAYWSNGSPITAFDFVQTWKDMLNPHFPCPNAHLLYRIKNAEPAKKGLVSDRQIGIRAIDHRTLEITLEEPTPFFLEIVSFCVFYPINQTIATANAKWADPTLQNFVCSGPYRIKSYKRGNEILLEKNPYYWDKDNVSLENIRISIVPNEMTALKMYEMDELDILGLPFTGIPSDSVPSLMDKGLVRISPLPASTICCFNLSSFPFNNTNIRKAFAYAICRKEIIDNITQMNEEIGLNLIPKVLTHNESFPPFFQDGDKETAQFYLFKGLKELGITKEDLNHITLLHSSSGIYPKIAQALQNQWRKAFDIKVELQSCEYKIFLDKLTKRDFQMAECIWIAQYHDPMNFFERFKTESNLKNYPGYENPLFTNLLNQSMTIPDTRERYKVLREAEKIFFEDMPLTAIYHWNSTYMCKNYVHNLLLYPSGSLHINNISFQNDTILSHHKTKNSLSL